MHDVTPIIKRTAQDYRSDQEVRWCPGCGDTAILSAVSKALAELDIPREKYVFVSGIGCSSRFPYYMNTYGIHGIHGRAAAIATGVKAANPDLTVWMVTGDGDSMAIGGNHFIHTIRRNIDIKILLLNNQIYGLTKGQYSPTSLLGQVTKTSPYGTIEHPFTPGQLVIGSGGAFFARITDNNIPMAIDVLKQASNFRGTAVVEVLQNCVIFNDRAHAAVTDREFRDDRQLILQHGEPMIFGKNKDMGIMLDNLSLKVVRIGENGITRDHLLRHDAYNDNPTIQNMLIQLRAPEFPVALGIIRSVQHITYTDAMMQQIDDVKQKSKIKNITDLMNSGSTWMVT